MNNKLVSYLTGSALAAMVALMACSPAASPPGAAPTAATAGAEQETPAPTPGLTMEPSAPTAAPGEPTTAPQEPGGAQERLQAAEALLEAGRYEEAVTTLRALLAGDPPAEVQRPALLRFARASLLAGDHQLAADNLAVFLQNYPEDPQAPEAAFWLGQARAGQGDTAGAVEAFHRYLQQRPLLAGYVQEQIARTLQEGGDLAGAAEAYRAAANAAPAATDKVAMLEGLAAVQRERGLAGEAVAAYDEILEVAQNAGYRAQILFEAGDALHEAGRDDEAAARWNTLVTDYPENAYAARALALLDSLGRVQAGPLLQARVKLAAGDAEGALKLLRALAAGSHTAEAHYYAALAERALGRHEGSLQELDALLQDHAESPLAVQALYEKGQSLDLLGRVESAVQVFRTLNARHPQEARGVEALYRIAQVYDASGRAWDASAAYAEAARKYPDASYAATARFRAGLVHYLGGAVQTAAKAWAASLPLEPAAPMQARLHLWLGKAAAAQGDSDTAQREWQQAQALDPEGFWGLRAADLLAGRRFSGRAPDGAFDPARYAPRGDLAEAEQWLADWTGEAVSRELPQALREDPAFQRGMEFWALGDSVRAYGELQGLTAAYKGEPGTLYALAVYAREQGLYQLSITAADALMRLAPAAARAGMPRAIEEMAYPTYYADLVLPEAQPTQTDPLLFLALVRQESLFNAGVSSYADARGLAQVIPSTGEYIAGQIGDTSYAPERLWRPAVSVRYGVWYLSRALSMFDDNALMALVGYNAGPGNAASWGEKAQGDDDIYFELVSNAQPRAYMQRIYEHRAHYERLYR